MIYVGENKSVLCKGDFHPAQLYKGDKKIAGYTVEEFEGIGGVTLVKCYNDKLHNAVVYGNSVQDGTPTPEVPVEVQSVGEKVTEGEYAGRYKISITAIEENGQYQIFDIFLDEPLRKIGEHEDYIDFEKNMVVRNIGKKVFNGTERWAYDLTVNKNGLYNSINNNNIETLLETNKKHAISNRLPSETWGYLWNNYYKSEGDINLRTGVAVTHAPNDKLINFRVCPYSTMVSPEEWKAQLQTWYEEGNPFTVWYGMPATEYPIDLPTIPTFKGTTIYEVNTSISAEISGNYKRQEVK